jgi:hypothetical protein
MIDIYSYFNSRDIAAHCRKIGKTWDALEMAIIIGHSRRPLAEKHNALRALIAEYPDVPVRHSHLNEREGTSTHQALREIIDYEERVIERFLAPEPGAVYTARNFSEKFRDNDNDRDVYSTFDKALGAFRERWEKDEAPLLAVSKRLIDTDKAITLNMAYDGAFMYISYDAVVPFADARVFFDDFYIDIPAPFKKGDILVYESPFGEPWIAVLDDLNRDDPKRHERALTNETND